ncbi:MAG: 8-oxo-dGTP diphosphatase MutT [Porticoccaceae bacterium]|jgi:8-oxo-dGTP diphosphatase
MISNSSIHVAVGVIFDNQQADHILIAKRPQHLHQGGLWEFPGGKVAAGETVDQALKRELFEELGITVTQSQPLMQVEHNYSDKQVFLDIWTVIQYSGEARGLEGQECRWVAMQQLLCAESKYQFPEANKAILEKLKSL